MSRRPPPKISHDWARGKVPLGSTVDQQPEGKVVRQSQEEVARRAKIFHPTQSIPKPICDRSGQSDITQDVIGVQTCPSEENKNVGVEHTHGRSGQPDKRSDAVHHEIKMLNIDNELIRERIEGSSSTHIVKEQFFLKNMVKLRHSTRTTSSIVQSTRRTLTSTFQAYRILL